MVFDLLYHMKFFVDCVNIYTFSCYFLPTEVSILNQDEVSQLLKVYLKCP